MIYFVRSQLVAFVRFLCYCKYILFWLGGEVGVKEIKLLNKVLLTITNIKLIELLLDVLTVYFTFFIYFTVSY